jgi:competence protein ComEC
MRMQWVWMAVGAVGGSLLAHAFGLDFWSVSSVSVAVVASMVVVIWSGANRGSPRVLRRLVAIVRGTGLAVAWAGLWAVWMPNLPAPKTSVGELARGGEQTAVTVSRVVAVPEPRPEGWILEVEPESLDGRPVEASGWRLRVFWASPPGRRRSEADSTPPLPGDVIDAFIRLDGYPVSSFPGRDSPRRIMARRGIAGRGIIDGEISRESPTGWAALSWGYRRIPAGWRTRAVEQMVARLGIKRGAFPAAMILGAKGLLAADQTAGFDATGTAHLLAISGLHLGVVGAGLWWLLGSIVGRVPPLLRRWGRRRVCGIGVVGLLGAYVLAIGAPTSAVRAWWMVACGVAAVVGLRPVEPFRMLAAAVYALIAADPLAAGGLGFQLSVGATTAILIWVQRLPAVWSEPTGMAIRSDWTDPDAKSQVWRDWSRRIGVGVGVSVMATLVTWPIIVSMTGELPVIGLVANVVVTPVASATIIPWMFIGGTVAALVGAPGWWMVSVGARAMEVLGVALTSVSTLDAATWVTGVPAGEWTLIGVVGALTVAGSRGHLRPMVIGGLLLITSLGATPMVRTCMHQLGAAPLRMHAIPVGQGDATLIVSPRGQTMLVDAGGTHFGRDPGRSIVVPYLKRIGIAEIDWVVASHADTDHIGGLTAVVREMSPSQALYDAGDRSRNLAEWIEVLDNHRIERRPIDKEGHVAMGRVDIDIVRPDPTGGSANDRSLYIDVGFAGRRLVLPGDIEAPAERWLAARGHLRRSAIIKVPHHGSKTSSSRQLLAELRPLAGIVSAGADNPFGHPHPRVLRRLAAANVDVWTTARHGLVVVAVHHTGRVTIRAAKSSR